MYVYENAVLFACVPTDDLVMEKHPAGICASYACDYIKKSLDKKKAAINLSTYELAKRVNKMINRQKKYESSGFFGGKGDLKFLFDSYGIQQIAHRNFVNDEQGDGWSDAAYFDGLPSGLYYVAFEFAQGGHAIAYDKQNNRVADANAGVFALQQDGWPTIRNTVTGNLKASGSLRRIQVITVGLK